MRRIFHTEHAQKLIFVVVEVIVLPLSFSALPNFILLKFLLHEYEEFILRTLANELIADMHEIDERIEFIIGQLDYVIVDIQMK